VPGALSKSRFFHTGFFRARFFIGFFIPVGFGVQGFFRAVRARGAFKIKVFSHRVFPCPFFHSFFHTSGFWCTGLFPCRFLGQNHVKMHFFVIKNELVFRPHACSHYQCFSHRDFSYIVFFIPIGFSVPVFFMPLFFIKQAGAFEYQSLILHTLASSNTEITYVGTLKHRRYLTNTLFLHPDFFMLK